MRDIVERLLQLAERERPYGSLPDTLEEAAAEIERLREWNREIALNAREFVAENEKLRATITVAIRQHEEGNKGLAHRTLCEAVYGAQA